jgi:hypothetical protein
MDIRLEDILANEDFVGQKIGFLEIGKVLAELPETFHDFLDIRSGRLDEQVDIERCSRVSIRRECRRADHDEFCFIFA